MAGEEEVLESFDMTALPHTARVLIIGNARSGKTHLIADILLHRHRDVPVGTLVSSAMHRDAGVPPSGRPLRGPPEGWGLRGALLRRASTVHRDASPALLEGVLSRQRLGVDQKHALDPRAFLVIDDVPDFAYIKHESMRALFANAQALDLLLLWAMQFPMRLPLRLRSRVDYVFVAPNRFPHNRQRLYDDYGHRAFPSFALFCKALDLCAADRHAWLVLRVGADPRAFWYKAPAVLSSEPAADAAVPEAGVPPGGGPPGRPQWGPPVVVVERAAPPHQPAPAGVPIETPTNQISRALRYLRSLAYGQWIGTSFFGWAHTGKRQHPHAVQK